jgi:uncharacterized lipoprotein YbaY
MRPKALLLAASLLLSACSSSSPAPTPTPAPGLSIATQRLEAQAAMVTANGIQIASLLAAVLASLSSGQSSASGPAPCKNGVRITKEQISAAKFKVTVDVFYDSKCTTIFNHAVLKLTLTSASSLGITGQTTTYDPSGKAVVFGALLNTTKLGSTTTSVTQGTISRSRGGPTALAFGLSCSLATKNSCGFGGIAATPGLTQSLGVSASLHNFVASGTANDGVVGMTAYSGPLGGLKLRQGSGTSWTVSGGSRVADFTGTFKEQVEAKALDVRGSVSLKDARLGATTSAGFNTRAGIDSGSVRQISSGKQFATFSTDAVGSGTIQYSDTSTGKIAFFIVTS